MRNIATKVKVKRLQNKGKRAKKTVAYLKHCVLHTMKRYLRWTINNGGGIIQIFKPDGSFTLYMIWHKDDLNKLSQDHGRKVLCK